MSREILRPKLFSFTNSDGPTPQFPLYGGAGIYVAPGRYYDFHSEGTANFMANTAGGYLKAGGKLEYGPIEYGTATWTGAVKQKRWLNFRIHIINLRANGQANPDSGAGYAGVSGFGELAWLGYRLAGSGAYTYPDPWPAFSAADTPFSNSALVHLPVGTAQTWGHLVTPWIAGDMDPTLFSVAMQIVSGSGTGATRGCAAVVAFDDMYIESNPDMMNFIDTKATLLEPGPPPRAPCKFSF